jgi:hypothetical protein
MRVCYDILGWKKRNYYTCLFAPQDKRSLLSWYENCTQFGHELGQKAALNISPALNAMNVHHVDTVGGVTTSHLTQL